MFLCFPFFQKKDFNFSDAPPRRGGGIQNGNVRKNKDIDKAVYLMLWFLVFPKVNGPLVIYFGDVFLFIFITGQLDIRMFHML